MLAVSTGNKSERAYTYIVVAIQLSPLSLASSHHEITYRFTTKQDLAQSVCYARALKIRFGFGNLQVTSSVTLNSCHYDGILLSRFNINNLCPVQFLC